MIEIKSEPTARELRVFAALWLAFWIVLARITIPAGDGFLVAGAVTGGCLVLSLLLNRDVKGAERWWGAGFPLGLLGLWALGRAAAASSSPAVPRLLLAAGVLIGLGGAGVVLVSRVRGISLYRVWMLAAMPIGWVLSHAMMLAVFYGVVTPIGLLVRAAGRDPMTRRFERSAGSYWVPHTPAADRRQYFKQS